MDPQFPSLAPAPTPAASLRDPALYGPNDPPAPGTRAVPPPPEIMATEASSLVNRRIELALLHNEVQTAQSLLAGAKAGGGGGGGSGGASSGGAPPSTPLLDRLLPDPVFQSACDTVGVAATLFSHGGAGAGGEREELDLIKKLALVLTQMKMERVASAAHGHGTRASKW